MDKQLNAILEISVIPKIIDLIMSNEGFTDIKSLEKFYHSKTFELLSDTETELWHLSPLTIYNMWKTEHETGVIEFPEEQ